MKTNRVLLGALAMIALAAAQASRADDKISLVRSYKEGDTNRFKATINANVMGADVSLVQTMKYTVKEVKKNGDVVILQENEGGKLTVMGMEQDQPATPPVTETRDKFGRLVEIKRGESPGIMAPEIEKLVAMLSETLMPEKPVAAGDTWQNEMDNPAVKGKKFTIKSTYVGTDKVDGVDLWKIKQTTEAETDDKGAKMSWESTSWLIPSNGNLAKAEVNLKDLPTQFGPLSWTMKLEQVKPGSEKAEKKDAPK